MAFDALTPTIQHSIIQADHIADYARKLLTAQGWGVLDREEELRRDDLIGHLDIRAYHHDYGEAIIDLKSGAQIGAAWLQCGGYIHLSNDVTTPMGGVLHVPRVAISKDVKGSLEFRDGLALEMAWVRNHSRIAEIIEDNEGPTYSPGYHCGPVPSGGLCGARCGCEMMKIHILNTPATALHIAVPRKVACGRYVALSHARTDEESKHIDLQRLCGRCYQIWWQRWQA